MRIISGIRKGLKLKPPEGVGTRPTTDRVKESVFNIIQPYLPAENVLDLFAGSGALGIEALSRHSSHCVFTEHNKTAYNLVKHNIELARFTETSSLIFTDALNYLNSAKKAFDLIFLDPPYNMGLLEPVLTSIKKHNLLAGDGIIVIETEKDGESAEHPDFEVLKCVTYGKTVITILSGGA